MRYLADTENRFPRKSKVNVIASNQTFERKERIVKISRAVTSTERAAITVVDHLVVGGLHC